jgi:DNA-binding NarL/FixJ family response regulator
VDGFFHCVHERKPKIEWSKMDYREFLKKRGRCGGTGGGWFGGPAMARRHATARAKALGGAVSIASAARLLECLQEAVAGGAPMSPPVARRVVELFRDFRPPEKSNRKLTPHEARFLGLLVDGHNLKTAAAEIGVSRATIAWHMRSIYEKLQVHSKSEAVAKALRSRMIR